MCVYVLCVFILPHVWSSEAIFQKLLFSFYHTGPKNGIQVFRSGNKYLYPLNYLVNPYLFFL